MQAVGLQNADMWTQNEIETNFKGFPVHKIYCKFTLPIYQIGAIELVGDNVLKELPTHLRIPINFQSDLNAKHEWYFLQYTIYIHFKSSVVKDIELKFHTMQIAMILI